MELRQLRYFVKAAETLNFSEAAKALCIAQSTLSQQVKQLEDELGVELFQRGARTISLTEMGEQLLPCARRTILEADTCVARVNDMRNLLTGTLNIGVTYSFSPVLTETLMEFMKQHPHVRLNILYKPMAELMDMLRQRDVDFVLAFRPSVRDEDIESHLLFVNHLAVIVREGHPLASVSSPSLADVGRYDVALPSQGLQARAALDACLAGRPEKLRVRIELNEVNILLKLVKQSDFVTVLAEATVYSEPGVRALRLNIPANEMDGCVHMLRNAYRKRSALEFIRMLRESEAVRRRVRDWFV